MCFFHLENQRYSLFTVSFSQNHATNLALPDTGCAVRLKNDTEVRIMEEFSAFVRNLKTGNLSSNRDMKYCYLGSH